MTGTEQRRRSLVEKALNVFTEVRAGEGARVLVMTANIYLILTAYYIIKPVREALILAGGGAEVAPHTGAGGEVDGIGHIVELVRDCGALDRSHEAALSRAAAAEEAIGELPASQWKDAMESLASYAVSRRY